VCVCVLLSYQLLVCFEYSDRRNDSIKSHLGNDFCYVKSQDDFQAMLEIPTNVSKLNGENLAKLSMYLCFFCFVDSFMTPLLALLPLFRISKHSSARQNLFREFQVGVVVLSDHIYRHQKWNIYPTGRPHQSWS